MGKKNPVRAPFYFYMLEIQRRERARGNNLSMGQMPASVGNAFKELTAEERAPYDEMARRHKQQRNGGSGTSFSHLPGGAYGGGQLTSIGTSVMDEEENERDEELYEEHLRTTVEEAVKMPATIAELKEKKFYFMAFNVLCTTSSGISLACEIGIVEYTMEQGITKYFHHFLDAGDIPMGYTRLAKEHSESSHKIPILNFSQAVGNNRSSDNSRDMEARKDAYVKVAMDIVQFMKDGKEKNDGSEDDKILVFTQTDQMQQTVDCLKFIGDQADTDTEFAHYFKVLDATFLLFHLCRRIPEHIRPIGVCAGDLSNSVFDYSSNTNCDYHDELDNKFCALGVSKRICYMISEIICKVYSINATTAHIPNAVSDNFHSEELKIDEKSFAFNPKKRYYNTDSKPNFSNNFSNDRTNDPRVPRTRNMARFNTDAGPSNSGGGQWGRPLEPPAPASNDPRLQPRTNARDPRTNKIMGVGRGRPVNKSNAL